MNLPVQLVKGGKHTFGWAAVSNPGIIAIPPEAIAEYALAEGQKLIVVPGSRTSGGFGLASRKAIRKASRNSAGGSILGAVLEEYPALGEFRIPEGQVVEYKGRPYCWVRLRRGVIRLAPQTLACYGIRIGDKLLVIRGSGVALGFAVRGPIVQEAEKHRELPVCEFKGQVVCRTI
jgi:hypothetical protein